MALIDDACLAIDAGNSKTDVALVSPDGTVLGTARGGGFQPPAVGVPAAMDVLAEAVRAAALAADADPAVLEKPAGGGAAGPKPPVKPPVADVSAFLANADLPREERALTAAVSARGWGREVHVGNDTFALLRAGLPDGGAAGHGVAVVCGAGINCVGRDESGHTHRFPALGKLSGDWGGGGGLAEEALWHAARAADGRGEPTELARTLPAHFRLGTMYDLIEALHLGDIPVVRKLEATPLLFEAAASGDAVARSLVLRQADEVAAMAGTALEELGLTSRPTPVVLGGGILAAQHPLLHRRLTEQLAARAPAAMPRVVTAPPVLGAALLGLDRASAKPRAYERLRAHHA